MKYNTVKGNEGKTKPKLINKREKKKKKERN